MTSDLGFSGIVIPSAVEGFLPPCGNQRVCAEGKRCLGVVSHATMSFCHRDFSLALEMTTARSAIKTLRRFIIFLRRTTISHSSFLIRAKISLTIKGQYYP